ncbi:MAG: hypothetical protein R3209_08365 [Salinimicrobium sediminis]|uniref:Outer membrane protein beta-barrel domain-containing protein n=1 Tax=Salinimicrobium sediminis TaxID=1343891 RepID=A0A285X4N0_9FLAO|nr:hypothetical protein [Salinimicrobium sediminis]MDX1603074.1 hypothetical protein [Salinimicrobium sediminis]SOC80275.1 hypothetical protein SAMN06296241_1821 [Salinimicrobium sediminis]
MKKIFLLIFLILAIPATSQVTETEEEVTKEIIVEAEMPQSENVQEVPIFKRDTTQHEIHLNILNVLVFGALDVAYERVLTDHSSAGVELFTKVFNKNVGEKGDLSKVYAKDYSITAKFKYFFDDETVARGYYANVFGMFSNGTNETEMDFPDPETGDPVTKEVDMEYTDLAFGIGVGGKFVAKQGFLIDASFGIGRNFFDKYSPDIVILPSIYLGYRF